jgi:hypothetical protein
MLVKAVALVTLLAGTGSAQLVVSDPAQTTVSQLHLQVTQLHAEFMKLQLVQDAITLKNNYLQTKAFYDTVYAHSQHRGGLMGYYKDYFDQEFQNIAADEWRKLNLEGSSITGDTAVGRLVAQGAAAIGGATGSAINGAGGLVGSGMTGVDGGYKNARGALFSEQKKQVSGVDKMIAMSETRADATSAMIADLVKRGSSDVISDGERESIDMHATLLQLQVLSDMRQLLNLNAQILNAQSKQNLAETGLALKTTQDLAAFRAGGAQRKSTTATSDQMVHELQRRPGEQ